MEKCQFKDKFIIKSIYKRIKFEQKAKHHKKIA